MRINILTIEKKLGLEFTNKELLKLAFIHSSYWNENRHETKECNERLEFLGDSVLSLIVAEYLYSRFPEMSEGSLSDLRSLVVDATSCASFAKKLDLEGEVLLGKGEQANEGKGRETILADLFEAIIGAIYLDKGFIEAKKFFFTHFSEEIEKIELVPQKNWKAQLQEYVQKKYAEPPVYEVLQEWGPAHQKNFRIAVFIKKNKMGEGEGGSKKIAQQNAAFDALTKLIKR